MDPGYTITLRGPGGQPREVGCSAHAMCSWKLRTPNAIADDDPIVRAMFAGHLREMGDPGRAAGGHMRKRR